MTTRRVVLTPSFSSPIGEALARFLEVKRAAGYRYREEAGALRALDRFLRSVMTPDDPVLTLDLARAFVARRGVESETTRAHRVTIVREVCRFLALDEPRTAIIPPRWLGIHRRAFVPRVLTQEEGRRFLQACGRLRTTPGSPIRNTVLGTVLALLYLTGLRAGEALRLTEADIDFSDAVLRVRDTKFGKSRLVPIAADVMVRLRQCQRVATSHVRLRPDEAPFFPAPSGHAYSLTALRTAFHEALTLASIPRRCSGRSLRLHDLRHSFAVLRVLLWYRQEVDLSVVLPALATYMGHVGIASSQRYLQLTEELVAEITRRHNARFGYLITEGGSR
jgi:integrase